MGNDLHTSCCDVCSPFDKTDKRDRNLNQVLKQSIITSESEQVLLLSLLIIIIYNNTNK